MEPQTLDAGRRRVYHEDPTPCRAPHGHACDWDLVSVFFKMVINIISTVLMTNITITNYYYYY